MIRQWMRLAILSAVLMTSGPALARKVDPTSPEYIIGIVLVVGLLIVSYAAMAQSHQRLNDPNDIRTVYLEQLPSMAKLAGSGKWRVHVIRQSGNSHAMHDVTGSAQDAMSVAMTTFRRAKIDAVHIVQNDEATLKIARLYHDHRGSNEGKKVGSAEIVKIG
jgi:hypothetical protein